MQHKTSCNGIDPPMIGCGAFQIQDSRQCEHLRPTSSGRGKTASKFRAIGVSNMAMAPKVKIWKASTPQSKTLPAVNQLGCHPFSRQREGYRQEPPWPEGARCGVDVRPAQAEADHLDPGQWDMPEFGEKAGKALSGGSKLK